MAAIVLNKPPAPGQPVPIGAITPQGTPILPQAVPQTVAPQAAQIQSVPAPTPAMAPLGAAPASARPAISPNIPSPIVNMAASSQLPLTAQSSYLLGGGVPYGINPNDFYGNN